MEVDDAIGRTARDDDVLVPLEPGEVGGGHVVDHVDVAGEERRHAGGAGLDRLQDRAVEGRHLAPVVGVLLQDDAIARHVLDELPGTGAEGGLAAVELLGRRAAAGLVGDDRDRRHVVRHQRVGLLGRDPYRVVVDLLDGLALGVELEGGRRVRHVRCPLEGAEHVVGGEGRAVVETHALAELELPDGRVVGRAPFGGEPRQQLLARALVDEVVEDLLGDLVVRGEVVEVRIDRGRLRGEAHGQRALLGKVLRARAGGQRERGRARQEGRPEGLRCRHDRSPVERNACPPA